MKLFKYFIAFSSGVFAPLRIRLGTSPYRRCSSFHWICSGLNVRRFPFLFASLLPLRAWWDKGRLVVVSSSAAFVLSTVHKWCAIGEPNTCTLAYFSHTTQQSAGMFWVGLFFPWATAKRSTRTRKWVQYWQCFDRLGTRRRWTLVITPSRAAVTKCDMISRLFLVFLNTVGSLLVLWWIVFERFNP